MLQDSFVLKDQVQNRLKEEDSKRREDRQSGLGSHPQGANTNKVQAQKGFVSPKKNIFQETQRSLEDRGVYSRRVHDRGEESYGIREASFAS